LEEESMLMSSDDLQPTDELLQRAGDGDAEALDALLSSYRAYLRRLVELRLGGELRGRVDPSDVVQEAQLEIARRLEEYLQNPAVPFRVWIRRTAIEQIITFRRRHLLAEKRTVRREVPFADESPLALAGDLSRGNPSRWLRRRELAGGVRRIVAEMDATDREMIRLRHFEELTNQQVAEELQISPEAARKRHGRALRRFREKLIELGISRGS
jgi:RNA polymerase sigma-70 factor (ECF subfamily)